MTGSALRLWALLFPMLWLGWGGAGALAGPDPDMPPHTWATLAADGRYHVVVEPDVAWSAVEIKVGTDDATDLGAARPGSPIELRGWTDGQGPLSIRIQASTPKGHGITWEYSVDVMPTLVVPPNLLDGGVGPSRRGLRGWLRRVFRGA